MIRKRWRSIERHSSNPLNSTGKNGERRNSRGEPVQISVREKTTFNEGKGKFLRGEMNSGANIREWKCTESVVVRARGGATGRPKVLGINEGKVVSRLALQFR